MILKSIVITIIFIQFAKGDEYVEEILQKCNSTNLASECDKYKFLRFLEDFDFEWITNSFVSLVRVPVQEEIPTSPPKYRSDDSEFVKFFKFLRSKILWFLGTHSIAFQLPRRLDVIRGRSAEASEVPEDKAGKDFVVTKPSIFHA